MARVAAGAFGFLTLIQVLEAKKAAQVLGGFTRWRIQDYRPKAATQDVHTIQQHCPVLEQIVFA